MASFVLSVSAIGKALTHGQQMKVKSESVLTFQLSAPLRVTHVTAIMCSVVLFDSFPPVIVNLAGCYRILSSNPGWRTFV
jgi:hypothetical protein